MSKLTELHPKSNRMLYLGNVCNFYWYFMRPNIFGGILRKSRSFSVMRLIFPTDYSNDEEDLEQISNKTAHRKNISK